jgi:hypothetical protein
MKSGSEAKVCWWSLRGRGGAMVRSHRVFLLAGGPISFSLMPSDSSSRELIFCASSRRRVFAHILCSSRPLRIPGCAHGAAALAIPTVNSLRHVKNCRKASTIITFSPHTRREMTVSHHTGLRRAVRQSSSSDVAPPIHWTFLPYMSLHMPRTHHRSTHSYSKTVTPEDLAKSMSVSSQIKGFAATVPFDRR